MGFFYCPRALPINKPKTRVATNQHGGQMDFVDGDKGSENPHINYEPSSIDGLKEAPKSGKDYTPHVEGQVMRKKISRTNDYQQAGDRYRSFEEWERDDLILNLVTQLKKCNPDIQERMIGHFTQADPEYGERVRSGLA